MTVDTNILRYLSRRSSKNYNTVNSDRQTDRFKEKDSICVRACVGACVRACVHMRTYVCITIHITNFMHHDHVCTRLGS